MKTAHPTSGFTLIETMIAITILILAVVGPMVTANRAIVAAAIARDQLIASYLAQEGIEDLRGMRDNAYLALYPSTSNAWTSFLAMVSPLCDKAAPNTTRACTIDPVNADALSQCLVGSCGPLYLSQSSGAYTQVATNGVRTPFTRTIQVEWVTDTDERIISTVTWSFHGTPYSEVVVDHFTAWQ